MQDWGRMPEYITIGYSEGRRRRESMINMNDNDNDNDKVAKDRSAVAEATYTI